MYIFVTYILIYKIHNFDFSQLNYTVLTLHASYQYTWSSLCIEISIVAYKVNYSREQNFCQWHSILIFRKNYCQETDTQKYQCLEVQDSADMCPKLCWSKLSKLQGSNMQHPSINRL
jgi:hypothetical protein